jgi:ELP3 family radical SAM enzyme/protein acetyltransferase
MKDIEDFIKTKGVKTDEYNTMNHDEINKNLSEYNKIIIELLNWIKSKDHLTSLEHSNELYELFKVEFTNALRRHKVLKPNNTRKSVILYVIKHFIFKEDLPEDLQKYFELLKLLLRKKPFRNSSGVTIITLITAPFPEYTDENGNKKTQSFSCKHNCYYCPNEPAHKDNNWQAQPRSYLYWEPAVQRANEQKFTAIGQMFSRLDNYYAMGHVCDKVELIDEGGTLTEYPPEYVEQFHRDAFYAANIYLEFRETFPNYDTECGGNFDLKLLDKLRKPLSIREEIEINKTAQIHIIGICIETRPDALDDIWLQRFREWGVTRIQLGAQHVDNQILKKINRGHTIEQLLWAMQYLLDNCFKIDIHIMPDLPGSTPQIDRDMFDYVYSIICPDQMKVYPCEVVPWTIIEKWYKQGKYEPYFENNPKDLFDVVRYSMETCPNWCRLPRVIRDIPSNYIQCGNTHANLRQMIDNQLDKEGVISKDIRSREIGRHTNYYNKPAQYSSTYYYANNGHNYFIEYESTDKRVLFGFIRLRFVEKNNMTIFNVLKNRGLIRELHVYGDTTAVNTYNERGSQHKGIGKGLVWEAEKKTMEQGLYGIVVISGEGVKGYYEKLGYREVDTFMIKDFPFWKVWFYILLKYIMKYIDYLINDPIK